MARTTKAEQTEAIERLREWLKPGDKVYCILRHVSSSGMSRTISLIVWLPDGSKRDLSWNVATALGWSFDEKRQGIRVSGCGMDMGFHVVYTLSSVLFREEGFDCTGEGCPSNDHSNGDRDRTPHRHSDPGYALRSEWL